MPDPRFLCPTDFVPFLLFLSWVVSTTYTSLLTIPTLPATIFLTFFPLPALHFPGQNTQRATAHIPLHTCLYHCHLFVPATTIFSTCHHHTHVLYHLPAWTTTHPHTHIPEDMILILLLPNYVRWFRFSFVSPATTCHHHPPTDSYLPCLPAMHTYHFVPRACLPAQCHTLQDTTTLPALRATAPVPSHHWTLRFCLHFCGGSVLHTPFGYHWDRSVSSFPTTVLLPACNSHYLYSVLPYNSLASPWTLFCILGVLPAGPD